MTDASLHPMLDPAAWKDAEQDSAIVVADGSQIRVTVRNGHLSVLDGPPGARRERRYPRVPRTLARLVLLSGHGYVTLEATRWLDAAGVGIVQLDRDGRALMTSPGQRGDARLRVAQVLASESRAEISLEIMRHLISAKVQGQAAVIRDVLRHDGSMLDSYANGVTVSASVDQIAGHEGVAAREYWNVWKRQVHVPFSPADSARVPVHWLTFAGRASLRNPLSQGKNATDPVNALLNYAYGVAGSEATRACHIQGLDPAIGFGHTSHDEGDALTYDLLEALRPAADRAVLSLLDTGLGVPYRADGRPAYLDRRGFHETSEGVCRLEAPLTHDLAARVMSAVAPIAGRYASWIAARLAETGRYKLRTAHHVAHDRLASQRQQVKSAVRKLHIDLLASDVISDSAWEAVKELIPPEPARPDGRHKTQRLDSRIVLAGIVAHEDIGVSWRNVPRSWGLQGEVCRRRLIEWQAQGVWPDIRSALATARGNGQP